MENTNNKTYKRQDRSVPDNVRKQISNSLKSYNLNHPRGKASEGSKWSQNISNGLKADTGGYWSHIKRKEQGEEGGDTTIQDIML